MTPALIFALVWAVLAVGLGILLVAKRVWLAETIRREREAPGMRPGLRSPKPALFLVLGLVFALAGAFIILWLLLAAR